MRSEIDYEELTKDRFIEILRIEEGTVYQVKARHVPNRRGLQNFDYLLISSNDKSLALEITGLHDIEQSKKYAAQRAIVKQQLSTLIKRDDLPGTFCIHIPWAYTLKGKQITMPSLKAILNSCAHTIAKDVVDTANKLQECEEAWIQTDLGPFRIERVIGSSATLLFHSSNYGSK